MMVNSADFLKERAKRFQAKRLADVTVEDIGLIMAFWLDTIQLLENAQGRKIADAYSFNRDYPGGDVEFLGLYKIGDKFKQVILRPASEPMGELRFVTEDGGPPHYMTDPIAWAHLPVIPDQGMPVETIVGNMLKGDNKIPPGIAHRMELQHREFETLDALIHALKQMPAVVDDDYPEMRHKYDSALITFLQACKANGRFERVR